MVLDSANVAKIVAIIEDGRVFNMKTNSFNRRPDSGRKRSTTPRDDRFTQTTASRNRHLTAVSHRNELRRVRPVNVSLSLIRRRLYETNLSARRPLEKPELLLHHRRARLRKNERYAACTFSPKVPFGAENAHTGLAFVENGSMTPARYIKDILLPHVVQYGPFVGNNVILMQNNANPHTPRVVREFLDEVDIMGNGLAWA
ncbi:hypothetical protein ILUMI_20833 [Ignelater luminosus]|uniref:Transposase Tc1-like domain-containing protein n=1 Tax=Ignelater luminosus TaxID=2038154 RepID=A0A8K0CFR4_IGNLU|nr:hypothetical protein ILUMI_20833 [Ignelater luminosus]